MPVLKVNENAKKKVDNYAKKEGISLYKAANDLLNSKSPSQETVSSFPRISISKDACVWIPETTCPLLAFNIDRLDVMRLCNKSCPAHIEYIAQVKSDVKGRKFDSSAQERYEKRQAHFKPRQYTSGTCDACGNEATTLQTCQTCKLEICRSCTPRHNERSGHTLKPETKVIP